MCRSGVILCVLPTQKAPFGLALENRSGECKKVLSVVSP